MAVLMLDRVAAPELLSQEVTTQVRPYLEHHGINADVTLCEYLVEFIEASAVGHSATLSAMTSEVRVLALIDCIDDEAIKGEAALEVLVCGAWRVCGVVVVEEREPPFE